MNNECLTGLMTEKLNPFTKKKKSKRFYTHVVNFSLCIHEELSLYPQYACKASGATPNCNFTGLGDR